jgi:hypothetical protein
VEQNGFVDSYTDLIKMIEQCVSKTGKERDDEQ